MSQEETTAVRREQALGNLLRAADALANGAMGNGHSIYVSKEHFDRLLDAIHDVKLHHSKTDTVT